MISIFYSTRKSDKKHRQNLEKSCSLKNVEIIEFVNEGTHSLPQAYNMALEQSKHDILVCIHDDVYMEKGWDKKLLRYFNNSSYGILGVAGTTNLPTSGMWWQDTNRMVGRVMHKNPQTKKWINSTYSERFTEMILPVVCVDGLLIGIHKKRIKEKFDERFDGFHFYDIPFCVANFEKDVEIGVVTDIGIKHDSVGMPNEKWFQNRQKFTELYESSLPLDVIPPIQYENKPVKIKKQPLVSVIIPTKNNIDYFSRCVRSLAKTNYSNLKIWVADTGSPKGVIGAMQMVLDEYFPEKNEIVEYDYYHFAKINNHMVKHHIPKDTELILFCNDDIEMLNDAISLMVVEYQKHKKHVGTIGCRLHYGDNSIQHGGIRVFLTKNNQLGVTHKGIKSYFRASFDKQFDVFGSTGAFLMVKKNIFDKIGGFDESTNECMEDVILNVDCIVRNLKNIYLGTAVCYHHESVTRKKNPDKVAMERSDLIQVLIPKLRKHLIKIKKHVTIL